MDKKEIFRKALFTLIIFSIFIFGLYNIGHYISSLLKPVYTLSVTDNITHREVFSVSGTDEITIENRSENSIRFSYKHTTYTFTNCSVKASDNILKEDKIASMLPPTTCCIILFVCFLIIFIAYLHK